MSERKDLNQADLGWCCSYAFADMIAAKTGKLYSPVDIAITNANSVKRNEGCRTDSMIKALNDSDGLCREGQFGLMKPKSELIKKILSAGGPKNNEEQRALEKYYEEESFFAEISFLQNTWKQTNLNPRYKDALLCDARAFKSALFSNFRNMTDIGAVIQDGSKDAYEFIYKLARKNCNTREKVHLVAESIGSGRDSIDEIFNALNAGKAPMFTIDARKLFGDVDTSLNPIRRIGESMIGNHAVTVVGVRPLNGKCYVKVRDSGFGGTACSESTPRAGVLCKDPNSKNDGTYELEVDTFIKTARTGVVLQ